MFITTTPACTRRNTAICWESLAAIRAFAGDDIELARYYPKDDEYLLERPRHVRHYECHGDTGARNLQLNSAAVAKQDEHSAE